VSVVTTTQPRVHGTVNSSNDMKNSNESFPFHFHKGSPFYSMLSEPGGCSLSISNTSIAMFNLSTNFCTAAGLGMVIFFFFWGGGTRILKFQHISQDKNHANMRKKMPLKSSKTALGYLKPVI